MRLFGSVIMSMTRSAYRRHGDHDRDLLDDSRDGWVDPAEIGWDSAHTARHGGAMPGQPHAAPSGSRDTHESGDEHQVLVDDDHDPDEGQDHGANAHGGRDDPDHGDRGPQGDEAHGDRNRPDEHQGPVDDDNAQREDDDHGVDAPGAQDGHGHHGEDVHEARDGQ